MTHTPIASLFAGVPLALSRSHGAALLQMPQGAGAGDRQGDST
ncbi:hypothetical protein [Salipiger marinus]